ncbi:hypothetical protein [Thioclava indica]|uniref:Uncharacterized protein n=1 Tax=Thioclava indica TaxID=1353528 RepID=A0A074JZ89_9RHOB|nr:hypothetical protein [Thioclava indica]KEO61799.1 hypothetical protein DT23_02145 [Thioclava indica]
MIHVSKNKGARSKICARLTPLAMLCALAQPAQAAEPLTPCPTSADLHAEGIILSRTNPRMSEAFRYENGQLIGYRADDPDLGRAPQREIFAHPLAITTRQSAGREFTLRYTDNPTALDTLSQKGRWSSPVALLVDGKPERQGTITYTYRGPGSVQIGTCTYPVWQVVERVDLGDLHSSFLKEFAPDPGIVLRSTKLDPKTSKALSQVAFDAITVRKKKPTDKGPE